MKTCFNDEKVSSYAIYGYGISEGKRAGVGWGGGK